MSSSPESYPFSRKVATLGGGTGHFALLRGLVDMNQPEKITAITGTWDNGGSSGRLRVEMGVLPSGDIRQCLLALMEDPRQRQVAQRLFNERLSGIAGPMQGHALGNLIESQLQLIYQGQDRGIDAARELFRVRANIQPVSITNLELNAKTRYGKVIEGETNIDNRKDDPEFNPEDPINAIYFDTTADPNPRALEAIQNAELVVFSAGDLYTSIIPHLRVKGIPEAINESEAKVCFVLNLMTKTGETDHFRASDFLRIFTEYLRNGTRLDYVIANKNGLDDKILQKYITEGQEAVKIDEKECKKYAPNAVLVKAHLSKHYEDEHLIRHNPVELAKTILGL